MIEITSTLEMNQYLLSNELEPIEFLAETNVLLANGAIDPVATESLAEVAARARRCLHLY